MSSPVCWIFFDVGDVLFNENPPHTILFHMLLAELRSRGRSVEWDEFNRVRGETVRSAVGSLSPTIQRSVRPFCGSDDEAADVWHTVYSGPYHEFRKPRPYGVLLDGIQPMIQRLHGPVRMGVIADQHPECKDGILAYGLGAQLEVIILNEMVGVSKPDPAIYRKALDAAGCEPQGAVMVGDRVDVDIAPAKALGMRTVRLARGMHYSLCGPRSEAETAEATVTDLVGLEDVLRRTISGDPLGVPVTSPAA